MKYLLDTNISIYLLNGNQQLMKKVQEVGAYSLALSHSVLAELYFGAYNSKRVDANLHRIEVFKRNLAILSESDESARLFGKIKADLRAKGNMVDDFDILIASVAVSNDCILITNNTIHFERIEDLKLDNWLI